MPNKDNLKKLMNFVQKEEPEEEDVDAYLEDRMKGDEQTYHAEEAPGFPVMPTDYLDVADDPEHWRHSSPHARPKRVNIVDEGSHPSWETAPSLIPEARAGIEAFPERAGEPHSDTPGKWPTLTVPSKQAYERDEEPATPSSYKPQGGREYMGRGNVTNSIQKLMSFVQIQKIGYSTEPQPSPRREDFKGPTVPGLQDYYDAVDVHIRNPQQSTQLNPAWETDTPTSGAVQRTGRSLGNQSFGIPAIGSKEHQKVLSTIAAAEPWNTSHLNQVVENMKNGINYRDAWDYPDNPIDDSLYTNDDETHYPSAPHGPWRYFSTRADPVALAHEYLQHIKSEPVSFSEAFQRGGRDVRGTNKTILDHMEGHDSIAEIHNILNYGEDYKDHPDAIKFRKPRLNPEFDAIAHYEAKDKGEKYDIPKYLPELGRAGIAGIGSRNVDDIDNTYMPFLEYQKRFANDHLDSSQMSNAAHGMSDELFHRLRMEVPGHEPLNEEPYHRTHYPETAGTGHTWGDEPAGMEEIIGQPIGQRGQEPTPEEQAKWDSEIIEWNKGRDPRYPQPGTPNYTNMYDTLEERRHEHDTREPQAESAGTGHLFPSSGGIYNDPLDIRGTRGRIHAKDKQLYDKFEGLHPPASRGPLPDIDAETKNAFERRFPGLYDDKEKSVNKLMKFMRKEGAVGGEGGGFDGLSDTVFTSTNAGIFTPTYGGKGTKKKHHKNNKRQDKKRRKLMGKEKKSGVERLVQYLYDGSPHIAKAGKMGLAPGLDADMTGDGATAHAGKNRVHSPAILNHKKTSRPLEDALQTAENNEPHVNMGLAGNMEASVAASYPAHSNVNAVGNAKVQPGPDWGKHNSYVQKAANQFPTMISPDGNNESADGPHPQKAFIERTKDNPNEAPAKDAVIKENDMQRRVKQYDNKASRRDGGQEQPAGVMAAVGMGGYPSGATMQMSSFGMNTYEQDSLARGGEEDTSHDEEEIDEKEEKDDSRIDEEGNMWIPMNPDRTKSLESMRKALEDAGDEAPLLTALHKLDYN